MDKIENNFKNYFYELNVYIDRETEFFKKSIKNEIEKYFDNENIYYKKLNKTEIDELKRKI